MIRKLTTLCIALLALFQIAYYIQLRRDNLTNLQRQIAKLDRLLQEASMEQATLEEERKQVLAEIKSVPLTILQGFADPEKKFVAFMDYLRQSKIRELGGKITVSGARVYENDPVPLQKTALNLQFSFTKVRELEELLDQLLGQREYPLQIERFEIIRDPEGLPQVAIDLALLIPDRIELPPEVMQVLKGREARERSR